MNKLSIIYFFINTAFINKSAHILILFTLLFYAIASAADESDQGYRITAAVSGVIKTINVKKGKQVKQGDLLLEFDDTLINSELSKAQAQLSLAKINLAEAEKELERSLELYDRTVLSEHDLQMAKISKAKASAQYSSARDAMAQAQWNKKHSKLYAPFNGLVTSLSSYQGQYVNNNLSAQTLLIIKKQ